LPIRRARRTRFWRGPARPHTPYLLHSSWSVGLRRLVLSASLAPSLFLRAYTQAYLKASCEEGCWAFERGRRRFICTLICTFGHAFRRNRWRKFAGAAANLCCCARLRITTRVSITLLLGRAATTRARLDRASISLDMILAQFGACFCHWFVGRAKKICLTRQRCSCGMATPASVRRRL